MSTKAPDWERLTALLEEVESLQADGKLDEKGFRRILAEAKVAVGSAGEGTECVLLFAEPEWLDRLDQPPPD